MKATTILSLFGVPTDEEAMWQVKTQSDHQEFARLVRRWEQPVLRLCTRMTGDPDSGKDLKQETFFRLFDKRARYEMKAKFSTFIWRIALNLCYDEIRRRNRCREFLRHGSADGDGDAVADPPEEAPGPDQRAAASEEGELVRGALLRLPDIYRSVLVLRHYEGMKLADIAEVLEIPEGTVNSRMAEGLARLSKALEPRLKPGLFSQRTQKPIEPVVI